MGCFTRYKVKEKSIREIKWGKVVEIRRAVIVEELTYNNAVKIELISSLNRYLYDKFKNKSITNAKNAADVICPFLNFIKLQVIEEDDIEFNKIKDKGIYGLNFYHAACYLNYCIEVRKVCYKTIMKYTDQILDFYEYLIDLELLHKSVCFTYTSVKKGKIKENPLKKVPFIVYYPSKDRIQKSKLNNMEEHLWQLFLEVSEKFTPEIRLGIVFAIFGGLRRGEIVNLMLDSLMNINSVSSNMIKLKIRDNQKELFKCRNVELSKCGVKKTRDQIVFNFNGQIFRYLEEHLILRAKILKQKNQTTNALFINKNGKPISGTEYEELWDKTKREFLKVLSKNSYNDYTELSSENARWGTHIGRGIFTNLCLIHGLAKSARELANLRGDTLEDSAKVYIDFFKVSEKIASSLKILSKEANT